MVLTDVGEITPQLAGVWELPQQLGSLFSSSSRIKLSRKPSVTQQDGMRGAYGSAELTRKDSRDPRWCSSTNEPRKASAKEIEQERASSATG